ncbi:hypothetical protein [Halorussus sp. MSC15.2]|uniref:hypothetical protein n=1 Tax=Halorussus sp. MSC15.2 TaxID=2283638 RepID=UPI0013D3D843|nr:hypothetical protein [Halorussus sp. MSC15.2]NEU58762.1 hypothetical protein [Halorussus sp. MSC15.2]
MSAEEWEPLGRKIVWIHTLNQLDDLEVATHRLAGKLRDGEEVTAEDIKEIRKALTGIQTLVEEDLSLLVDDIEPYHDALNHVPYDAFADYLDVSVSRLNELDRQGLLGDEN